MAARLNQVGVDHARGFSLNTANFCTTDQEIGYGEAISGFTNGSHRGIDTSHNGAGPAAEHWALRPPRLLRMRMPTPTQYAIDLARNAGQ
jgi:cellulase/cellobiase CelA1